jgi:hypothetical protein
MEGGNMDMYSRKYIRSPVAATERGMPVISNTAAPSPRGEEGGVYLPPDYTGMAFSGNGRGSPLQKNDEYPETLIPPLTEESMPMQEESLAMTAEEDSVEPEALESAEEPIVTREDDTAPPSREVDQALPPTEEPVSPQIPTVAPTSPLLTPELLRSLTLEDLLLFWMLLLLTTANPDDQLYLLLGLLLIQR